MTIKFGSGQTSGQPLLLTAITIGAAQTVHTFPAGAGTPEICEVFANNLDTDEGILVTLALYNVSAALVRSWSVYVPVGASLYPIFDNGDIDAAIVANGTCVLKAFAATASVVTLSARVDDQAAVTSATTFASGQTSGAPLVITAITLGTAQTVHTFPSGTNLCSILKLFGFNSNDGAGRTLHFALYNSVAALVASWDVVVAAKAALEPLFGEGETHPALICNGTSVLKAYADVASEVALSGVVTTQAAP